MKYRRLGRTGLRVSVVGVGTWQFGGEWGKEFTQPEVDGIMERARELGINLIDTAECYGDHLSEALVGRAVRRERDHWVIATKFGHRFIDHLQRENLWSPQDVRLQLEDSLRALQVEQIDLYQFHSGGDEVFDNDALWTMLDKQVDAGKIGHLGISISSGLDPAHQVSRAVEVGASTIQVVYNRLDCGPEETAFPSCIEQDLGVLARITLASGFLSGKYQPGARFTEESDLRSGCCPPRHEATSTRPSPYTVTASQNPAMPPSRSQVKTDRSGSTPGTEVGSTVYEGARTGVHVAPGTRVDIALGVPRSKAAAHP